MKKYILLTLHYCYFITALVFLDSNISIFLAIMLIAIISFEHIAFSILPLILTIYLPMEYKFILISIFGLNLILYYFIKKNRFYALASYLLYTLIAFISLYVIKGFEVRTIQISLLCLVIYAIINTLYVYQNINNKIIIIPYNQKLIYLVIILGYFFTLLLFSTNDYLMLFLFMQLYLIKDFKYNLIFASMYALYIWLFKAIYLVNALLPIAVSYLPVSILLTLNYDTYLWIPLAIYSIILNFIYFKNKKISFESDCINLLFDDFNKYLNTLNNEYNKNLRIKEIKEKKLEEISTNFCNKCQKNTLCKNRLEKRYSFISAAMLGMRQNIYECPYYHLFKIETNMENVNKSFEYSALKALGFELSFLYNQNLLLKKEYEKFIRLLANYNYFITDLDINLSSSSMYFSLTVSKNKPIIESLFLKCAYKAFGEELEIKNVDDRLYFYKKPKLKITYAHTVLAKKGNLMSGDNYYIKKDYNSSYIFALSDGMGSGYNAYTESADALKTIANLSSYHFRINTILKLLEDIYELRSNYDRYATLDFLAINTATCKLNLYKMGSTTTYILHNNKLFTYENQALPLKLDDVNSAYELDIYSGDFIFLLSDGISDFISNEEFYTLASKPNNSADEICYSIIEYIKEKEKNNLKDDLSLIVIKAI